MNAIKPTGSPSALSLTSWHSDKGDVCQKEAFQTEKDGLPWSGDKTMRNNERNGRQHDNMATDEDYHHELRLQDRLQQERQQQQQGQHDRLPHERLQHDRLLQDRLQHDRLPQDRLQHEKLPQDRLQHERPPQDRLQQQRLPQDRLQHSEHEFSSIHPPAYKASVQPSSVDGVAQYHPDAGLESRNYHNNTGSTLQNNPHFTSPNKRGGYQSQNNAGYAASTTGQPVPGTGRPVSGPGRDHSPYFGGGPARSDRDPYLNTSPSLQRNGVTSASFVNRGGIRAAPGGEEFQTIHVTGMRNSPSMNKLGSLFTSINKSVSSAFVNLIATPPNGIGDTSQAGHSSPYESLPTEGMRKAPYYTGLTTRGAHRGGFSGSGSGGHPRDERFFRGDSRESNGAMCNPSSSSYYSGENVGINRGYHEEINPCSTLQRPISSDMGMQRQIFSDTGRPRIDSGRSMPHGRQMPRPPSVSANTDNGEYVDRISPTSRTYNRSHLDEEKRDSEMMKVDNADSPTKFLDTNVSSGTKLGRDFDNTSPRRMPPSMMPRVSAGHPPVTAGHRAAHEGGRIDRGYSVPPSEHSSNVLRQRDINNSARNFQQHPGESSSRHRLHPVAGDPSTGGKTVDPRYHRRSPPYRSTSLETRSRTPSPTNDRFRVSPHPEYYGKTNLTDRSRSPSPPSLVLIQKQRSAEGPGPSPPQKPTELDFSNKRRNSRGSMPQMLPSPTVPPPDASSPSCINFPRLYPSPTHMVVPSPVSTTTTVSPGGIVPGGGASNLAHHTKSSRHPPKNFRPEIASHKPSSSFQRHRYDDDRLPPPRGKCQPRETIDLRRQTSVPQEIRLRSNVTLPRRRDVGLNQNVVGLETHSRPTSYPPRDLEEVDDSDSDDEGWC